MTPAEQPPEGRLTSDQRARMRAGLLAATAEPARRERPWLIAIAAAAAVAVLVAGIAMATLSLSDNDEGTRVLSGGPESTSASPTEPTETESTAFLEPGLTTSCDQEARNFLEGATRAGDIGYARGNTYLYTAHRKWLICDDWATADGGPPTVLATHPLDGPVTKDLFLISQNYSMDPAGGAQYFAGGDLIDGVTAIRYAFPTGETVEATITDTMWSMVYLLPDPPQRIWREPVVVAVTFDDGSDQEYFLTEIDLCAQVNHGC